MDSDKAQTGTIFDIQRFSIHDGPGIRTTVFVKGCPLRCVWCHNPESWSYEPELSYLPEKCINCGACVEACPYSCHSIVDDVHRFDRSRCTRCGLCAAACPSGALEMSGRRVTAGEVITALLKDRPFYSSSGGGVTVSGGEPIAQLPFLQAVLRLCKSESLHTCVETAGHGSYAPLRAILPYVDLFLFDFKETSSYRHRVLTGSDNTSILSNLRQLNREQKQIILRCPIMPGINDSAEHFSGIARLANELDHVCQIHLEPYHSLGTSKRRRFGYPEQEIAIKVPEPEDVDGWINRLSNLTDTPVRRS